MIGNETNQLMILQLLNKRNMDICGMYACILNANEGKIPIPMGALV